MEFYPDLLLLGFRDLKIYTWEITSNAIWFSWCKIKEIKQSIIYKIHPVRDITEQQEATVWASAKGKTASQWITLGIMGAGSRWNRWNARSTSKKSVLLVVNSESSLRLHLHRFWPLASASMAGFNPWPILLSLHLFKNWALTLPNWWHKIKNAEN